MLRISGQGLRTIRILQLRTEKSVALHVRPTFCGWYDEGACPEYPAQSHAVPPADLDLDGYPSVVNFVTGAVLKQDDGFSPILG